MPQSQYIRQRPTEFLERLALHHLDVVKDKENRSISNGITLDCASGLIALAVYAEALINLVGDKSLRSKWRERDPYHKKLERLLKRLKIKPAEHPDLFFALGKLKQVRDDVVHAKPKNFNIRPSTDEETRKLMQPAWIADCSPTVFYATVEQVRQFKDLLVNAANLNSSEYMSSGSYDNKQS